MKTIHKRSSSQYTGPDTAPVRRQFVDGLKTAQPSDNQFVSAVAANDAFICNTAYRLEAIGSQSGYDSRICDGVKTRTDWQGVTTSQGRLTRMQDHSGTTELVYDERGSVIQSRKTLTVAGQAKALVTTYQYNLADHLTAVTYPSGLTLNYQRDGAGRVTDITASYTDSATQTTTNYTVASNVSYLPSGIINGLTWGNGQTLTRTYDQSYQLLRQQIGTIQDLSYSYDANGNITAITDNLDSQYSADFQLDLINRLVEEALAALQIDYQYDPLGNRLSQSTTQPSQVDPNQNDTITNTYGYAADSNRLTQVDASTVGYTGSGNISAIQGVSYSYDVSNRISTAQSASGTTTYRYNGFGERTTKVRSNGNTVVYSYQGPQLLEEAEYDSAGTLTERRAYVWLGGMPVAYWQRTGTNTPELVYLHSDHLDTPRIATSNTGQPVWRWRSDAFGNGNPIQLTATTYSIGLRFPGQYYDEETQKHYNYFRDYDPSTGRYVQSDPIGLDGGLNTYLYAGGAPVHFIDPLGLVRWGDAAVSAAGATGNAFGIAVGAALWAAPEPTFLTKAAGAAVWSKSMTGFGLNVYNLTRALSDDDSYDAPGSAGRAIANMIDPCDENLKRLADVTELTLDLAAGRIPVASVAHIDSALNRSLTYYEANKLAHGTWGQPIKNQLLDGTQTVQTFQYSADIFNKTPCGCTQ